MFLSRWFRRGRRPVARFRPSLFVLEDRTAPAIFNFGFPPPGPATHLQVIVPEHVQAGKEFDVLVEALDASNHLATGYTGTVHFTGGGAGAPLPADYKFLARDHGIHIFDVPLATTGSQTLTATDTVTATI